jgi:single-stranded-DNA-specific exonuclease
VIAFAPGEGGLLKGSARSIPGLHIRDLLATVAARHPGLITRFGGHAMAAGLSLPREALEEFEAALEAVAGEWLDPEALRPVVLSDGPLLPHGLSLDTARALRGLGPWGQAFPEPVFDDVFELRRIKPVGGDHLKASLLPDSGQPVEAIEFRADPTRWPAPGGRLRLAYRADVNCYRGMESLQLVVEHVQAL